MLVRRGANGFSWPHRTVLWPECYLVCARNTAEASLIKIFALECVHITSTSPGILIACLYAQFEQVTDRSVRFRAG